MCHGQFLQPLPSVHALIRGLHSLVERIQTVAANDLSSEPAPCSGRTKQLKTDDTAINGEHSARFIRLRSNLALELFEVMLTALEHGVHGFRVRADRHATGFLGNSPPDVSLIGARSPAGTQRDAYVVCLSRPALTVKNVIGRLEVRLAIRSASTFDARNRNGDDGTSGYEDRDVRDPVLFRTNERFAVDDEHRLL